MPFLLDLAIARTCLINMPCIFIIQAAITTGQKYKFWQVIMIIFDLVKLLTNAD